MPIYRITKPVVNFVKESYLPANWPNLPDNVSAVTTLISGGDSRGTFSEYNLATHVGDNPVAVTANRAKLVDDLQLPSEPVWLEQVHSNKVIRLHEPVAPDFTAQADASVTAEAGVVCAVMTADCLPVFFCDEAGSEVAVAHAGWRGLHAGIISNTAKAMRTATENIQVSLGPAIGPSNFEVGEEVFSAFIEKNSLNKTAFVATEKNHYLCNIYQLARIELQSLGIDKIAGGEFCTYRDSDRFYSFRRQASTGRMASLIWLRE